MPLSCLNDEAGRRHAIDVAGHLQPVARSVRIVELPGLHEKGDFTDWKDAGGTLAALGKLVSETPALTAEEVKRKAADLGKPAEDWPRPIPLDESGYLPKFPVDALPGWLREFIEAEAEATQTPADLAGMLTLSVCAAACAKKAKVRIRPGWDEPLNVYAIIALPPASRKSAVFSQTVKPLETFEKAEIQRLAPSIAEKRSTNEILKRRLKELHGKAAKAPPHKQQELERQAAEAARQLDESEIPERPRLIVDDCTPERLATLLAKHGGRLAVMSPEGDLFDMMAGRYSRQGPNFGVFLKGHAGDQLRVDRVGRAPDFIEEPALTLGLAVQPDVLRGLIRKPGFRGRGLLARFLYSFPMSNIGRRRIAPPHVPQSVLANYESMVHSLLGQSTSVDEAGQSTPHLLRFGSPASAAMLRFEEQIESQLADGGALWELRDWGGKLAGAVCRIAGILHMIRHATEERPWEIEVSAGTAEGAIRLGEYLIPHAKAAFSEMDADGTLDKARQILSWLKAKNRDAFTKRDAHQALRRTFKRADELSEPLSLLQDNGFIRETPVETGRKGPGRKPSTAFAVNPYCLTHNTQNTQNRPAVSNSEDSEDSEYANSDLDSLSVQSAHSSSEETLPGLQEPLPLTGTDEGRRHRSAASRLPLLEGDLNGKEWEVFEF